MVAKSDHKTSVLFCCLGNICRSPMAEAVFHHIVTESGLGAHFDKIDSCGTGAYHVGEEPDERTVAVLSKKKIACNSLARAVSKDDFHRFDYIFGMDTNNVRNLKSMQPKGSKAQVYIFGEFEDKKAINDPYYGIGGSGFESTYEQCVR
ncbi:putative LTP1-protein-tyrosine-phosphatase [Microstroma glucosiphilum]|uniref:Putative LTP1-protein-tyrosine-phosphatase n=1 Tax=Pseudomicrostroma glucosiphilum TaxID=1684307 RepID=A0A316U1V9_9BASI|nr:putative LTP1-protein-tyrosine-phosphatase [Pseudomicrostroma glucosiphilum]PWN18471.1 putative LTP1-protein-tyrosine-phosphatase [Pseudomicrostroma glucosiphilum]